ncbi:putative sulfoacetate transporter SauU [Fundidesulfovibrio magnetotacticus]|uniref:Putative sulfoacetate transporter SauU n=1 Tax=Fundidesulfovibrio magnetotacticus TaxID=2730080 RepID=A0A6V8LVJ9_9BACT|nr:MFS transporter [Fundidesulfovibrio magnetotacticus]GFK94328.1 putative sulfoacetate transporter SauU [Fundidesulfovibrio magnetotacticus]
MSPRLSAGLRPYRSTVFASLALAYMLVTFHRLCPAVTAVDMMRDLHAGGGLIGALSGAFFYSYALMQLPAGLLADSWGARKATSAFFLVAAAGAACMGLAPDAGWAMAGRVLVGVGMSMIWVSTLKTLAEWYRPERFAAMTGLLVACGGLGSLLASAPLAWVAQTAGWRNAFLGLAVVSVCVSALLWLVVRDTPAQAGFKGQDAPHGLPPGRQALWPGVRAVLSNRWGWLLAAWLLLDNGVFFSLAGLWAGPYLSHVHGLPPGASGLALSMFSVGLITGGPLMSAFSTRLLKSRKKALAICAGCLSVLMGVFWLLPDGLPVPAVFALFYLVGVTGGATPVVAFTSVKELFPVSLAGTAVGIMNSFPFVGGALFQPLLGAVLEANGRDASGAFTVEGYRTVFLVLFVTALLLTAVCLSLRETYRPQGR